MKNSKKTWGILGTSMGSMLIIVALLTMVGMGSSDTYAGEMCSCSSDTTRQGNQCVKTVDTAQTSYICTTDACVSKTGQPKGSPSGDCVAAGEAGLYRCSKTTSKTEYHVCTCASGSPNPSGLCEADGNTNACSGNEYKSGNYCKPCPDNATCDGTSFKCIDGYAPSGNTCVGELPTDPTDYGKSECKTVNEPCTIHGRTGICTLTGGKKLCQITTSPSGGDDDDDKPSNPNKPTGGDDKPNNPNKPTGGDDKPSNPNTPTGGGDDGSGGNGGGGNSGGNSGGNGNGGNAGGNNGNNNGGNNTTKNPNTATKAPLAIAIIGIISVGISSVVYFKGKKEINTEI